MWSLDVPYKAIPMLLALGLTLQLAALPRAWPRIVGQSAIAASAILLAQAMTLEFYARLTARRHELVWPLPDLAGGMIRLLGVESVVDRGQVVIRSASQTCRIGLTWELLFDPASVCFVTGSLVTLTLSAISCAAAGALGRFLLRRAAVLLGMALSWSFVRMALLVAMVVHRLLRADAVSVVNVGRVLVNGWIQLGLVLGMSLFVALLWAEVVRRKPASHAIIERTRTPAAKTIYAALLTACGIGGLSLFLHWQPVGQRKAGRIMVVEKHSTWEPTTEPYNTASYGEKGSYNDGHVRVLRAILSHVSAARVGGDQRQDSATCDVLVIKTPTSRYSQNEVNTIARFVEQGGSLLLIGDHTNVFNMNTYLNDIARHFDFTFRNDLLFRWVIPIAKPIAPLAFGIHFAVFPIARFCRQLLDRSGERRDDGDSQLRLVESSTGVQRIQLPSPGGYRTDMHYAR